MQDKHGRILRGADKQFVYLICLHRRKVFDQRQDPCSHKLFCICAREALVLVVIEPGAKPASPHGHVARSMHTDIRRSFND